MKNVNIMGSHQFLGEGGSKKTIYMGNCLKSGLDNLQKAWQKIRRLFWRRGRYLDAHYDLILVHVGT